MLAHPEVAGNSQNRFLRSLAEQASHGLVDTAVNLLGCGTCGQGKIETVYPACLKQAGKLPQSRLGLARARFCLQNHQLFVEWNVSDRLLGRAWRLAAGQDGEILPSFESGAQPCRIHFRCAPSPPGL